MLSLAIAVDNNRLAVTIIVAVPIMPWAYDNRLIAVFALTDHFTVTIAVTVTVTGTNGDAHRANTNTDFFRTRRHRNRNRGHCDGSHYHMLDHRLLLLDSVIGNSIRENVNRSASTFQSCVTHEWTHTRMPNQIATAIIASTTTAQTAGTTRFELPLRGESLAA
jgi:hypothetical protein